MWYLHFTYAVANTLVFSGDGVVCYSNLASESRLLCRDFPPTCPSAESFCCRDVSASSPVGDPIDHGSAQRVVASSVLTAGRPRRGWSTFDHAPARLYYCRWPGQELLYSAPGDLILPLSSTSHTPAQSTAVRHSQPLQPARRIIIGGGDAVVSQTQRRSGRYRTRHRHVI